MTVAYVSSTGRAGVDTGGSVAFDPGTVPIVIAAVSVRHSTHTVTAITYGGVNMTLLDAQVGSGDPGLISVYYLVGPPAGSQTFSYTISGSDTNAGIVAAYSGVHTGNPFGTVAKANGTDSTPTVTVTSAIGEEVVDFVGDWADTYETAAAGAGQTLRRNQNNFGGGNSERTACYHSSEPGAASVVMNWTGISSSHSSDNWASIGVALKPAGQRGVTWFL